MCDLRRLLLSIGAIFDAIRARSSTQSFIARVPAASAPLAILVMLLLKLPRSNVSAAIRYTP
ncbi:hypothetical protein V7426_09450 [Bacillus thuringiensis]